MVTLSSSLEDYVEAIYEIVREKQAVRAKDIAKRLDVTRASVSGALRTLVREGLVNHLPYDVITMTEKGMKAARDVAGRHQGVRDFLISILRVDDQEAEASACAMEHAMTPTIESRLAAFVARVKRCPTASKVCLRACPGRCGT